MTIIDAHVHVGKISDTECVPPSEVKAFFTKMGIEKGAAMPVSSQNEECCFEKHKKLYNEMVQCGLDPILLITPQMIRDDASLQSYMCFDYVMAKIHAAGLSYTDSEVDTACAALGAFGIPMMFHTGYENCCSSTHFEKYIQRYPNQKFVLCHARPFKEAFEMLEKYANVWIDTAFLPFSELSKYVNGTNEDRILFGTDFPVNRWFPHLGSEEVWYREQITKIKNSFSQSRADKILYKNYCKLIGIYC